MIEKGAEIMQPLKPVKQLSQHVCTFAIYSHDMHRQIETHHFIHRLNEDFCQCAVYESDDPSARLIGVEYIISQRLFDALPPDEQKLWHSHFYEVCFISFFLDSDRFTNLKLLRMFCVNCLILYLLNCLRPRMQDHPHIFLIKDELWVST